MLLLFAACTERIVVRDEEEFSWESRGPMVWPSRGAIISPFGDSRRANHRGVDLAGRPGEPVLAALDGVVSYVGIIPGYGNVLAVTHARSLTTIYARLGQLAFKRGAAVSRGQTVGAMGPEGYIHFEIREGKDAVDPARFYAVAPDPIPGGSVVVEGKLAEEPAAMGSVELAGGEAARPPSPEVSAPTPLPQPPPAAVVSRVTATPVAVAALPTPTARLEERELPVRTGRGAKRGTPIPTRASGAALAKPTPGPTRAAAPAADAPEEPATAEPGPSGAAIAGAVAANLFYVPAKLLYAGLGAVTGAAAMVLSLDPGVASAIWAKSLGGDYFVTASHVSGEDSLAFAGTIDEPAPEPTPAPKRQRRSDSTKSPATSSASRRSPSTR